MNIIKVKEWKEVPENYTGVIQMARAEIWFKNGLDHRDDGPSFVDPNGFKSWHLKGNWIFNSFNDLDLTNQIVLSKTQHPEYPLVQVWKILGSDGLYEQLVIPGMEEFIIE